MGKDEDIGVASSGQLIGACPTVEAIIADAAHKRIGPEAAVQHIISRIAEQAVGAGQGERRAAGTDHGEEQPTVQAEPASIVVALVRGVGAIEIQHDRRAGRHRVRMNPPGR